MSSFTIRLTVTQESSQSSLRSNSVISNMPLQFVTTSQAPSETGIVMAPQWYEIPGGIDSDPDIREISNISPAYERSDDASNQVPEISIIQPANTQSKED